MSAHAVIRGGRLKRAITALLRNDHGSSVLEFAFAAPIVFLMVLATVELSVDMIIDASVQSAAQAAARSGLTTSLPSTGTRASQAQKVATAVVAGWLKLPNTTFTIKATSYSSYGAMSGAGTSGLGGLGDVVAYQITLTTPGLTGIPNLMGLSPLTFQRNYIVQNE